MRKLQQENGRLEKMLEKPVKDRVEVDNGHVEKIRTLMNDLRLLQAKSTCFYLQNDWWGGAG